MLDVFHLTRFLENQCAISLVSDQVLINCQSQKDYNYLIKYQTRIEEAIYFILGEECDYKSVTIGVSGSETSHSVIAKKIITKPMEIIVPYENEDLIRECIACENACAVVLMENDKGVFANSKITISRAHPNVWIGTDMSKYWLKEPLELYKDRLKKDRKLVNYKYEAILFDGNTVEQVVDARIIQWHGEEARIVKVLSQRILT